MVVIELFQVKLEVKGDGLFTARAGFVFSKYSGRQNETLGFSQDARWVLRAVKRTRRTCQEGLVS